MIRYHLLSSSVNFDFFWIQVHPGLFSQTNSGIIINLYRLDGSFANYAGMLLHAHTACTNPKTPLQTWETTPLCWLCWFKVTKLAWQKHTWTNGCHKSSSNHRFTRRNILTVHPKSTKHAIRFAIIITVQTINNNTMIMAKYFMDYFED